MPNRDLVEAMWWEFVADLKRATCIVGEWFLHFWQASWVFILSFGYFALSVFWPWVFLPLLAAVIILVLLSIYVMGLIERARE